MILNVWQHERDYSAIPSRWQALAASSSCLPGREPRTALTFTSLRSIIPFNLLQRGTRMTTLLLVDDEKNIIELERLYLEQRGLYDCRGQ